MTLRRVGLVPMLLAVLVAYGDGAGTEPVAASAAAVGATPDSTAVPVPATTSGPPVTPGEQRFPDVVDATAERRSDGTWTFRVTISSPYDTPDRYADAWRVTAPDGTVLGVRELLHDHATEQPFTRSLDGVTVPDDVDTVTVTGRDQEHGWGGNTFDLALDRR